MENITGHRRLPPQRTGLAMSQAGIAKAVVPEVSLVWEGEESVYWRPNSPCPRPAVEPSSALRTSSSMTLLTARPAVLPSRWPRPTAAAAGAVHQGHRYLMQQHLTSISQENTSGGIRGASQPMHHQLLVSSQSRQEGLRKFPLNQPNDPSTGMSNVDNMQNYIKSTENSGPQSFSDIGKVMSVGGKLEHQTSVSPDTGLHSYNSPPENTNDALARLMQVAEYNPLVYSSGERDFQTANSDGRRHTPQLRKDPKLIIPRAMDFTEKVSPNSDIRARKREDKENRSPVNKYNSGRGHSSSTSASDTQLRKGFENQIVPYDQTGSDSPQMQVSSPAEPYLCKMIDRKDQQIFQLHKVLEAVLSKTDGNCSTNSPSPQLPLKRAVETQTSPFKSNNPELRTVGVNTDITWSELLESLRESHAVPSEQKSVTILKNSNLRRSASSTVIQKSSNTSSVRFDTCQQMMEEDERIAEVRGVKEVAGAGGGVPQHCRCCQCAAIVMARTGPKSALLEVGGSQNRRNISDERQINNRDRNHQPSRNGHAQGERAAEATAEAVDPTTHYSGNNHREVSLTLRELVLTTIQEDPTSPQHSLHLDLPEYRGDSLHQQLPPNRQPSSPAASRRLATPRLIHDSNDHWPPGALTTAAHSHRPAPSSGDARGRLGPVETVVLASTTPRHHSTPSAHRVYGNRHPYSHGKVDSPSPNASNRCHGSKAQDPRVNNGRRDREDTEHQAQQCTGGGVTIYRNLVNNLQQILEPTSHHQAVPAGGPQQHRESSNTGLTKQAGNSDQHLDVLQQQLRHFGLSFLERKPVQEALGRTDGGLPHPFPTSNDVYRDNPRAGSTQPHDNKSPVDFSIATVEFLRQNGLLNAER